MTLSYRRRAVQWSHAHVAVVMLICLISSAIHEGLWRWNNPPVVVQRKSQHQDEEDDIPSHVFTPNLWRESHEARHHFRKRNLSTSPSHEKPSPRRSLKTNDDHWTTKIKHSEFRTLFDEEKWDVDDDFDDEIMTEKEGKIQKNSKISSLNAGSKDGIEQGEPNIEYGNNVNEKENGIIFSHNIESRESNLPSRRPPPPERKKVKPQNLKDDNNGVERNKVVNEVKGSIETHESHQLVSDDSAPADTIFDDILRGFSFAILFCLLIFFLHKLCWCTCVKLGVFPDERVLEARWRRLQLKNKRAYYNPSSAPLDTKSLGKWLHNRANALGTVGGPGGAWENFTDDLEHDANMWEGSSAGEVELNDDGISMMVWEDHGREVVVYSRDDEKSTSTDMELEYGEGDELEDKSHDSRLFDLEDGGKGTELEADKFFKGRMSDIGNVGDKFCALKNGNHLNKSNGGKGSLELSSPVHASGSTENPDASEECIHFTKEREKAPNSDSVYLEMSDGAFFDALEPPSGFSEISHQHTHYPGEKNSCFEAFGNKKNDLHHSTKPGVQTDADLDDDSFENSREFCNSISNMEDGDKGYDVESDLLGLRSDSPPPLDLEEIEKTLRTSMEKAKLY